MLAGQNLELLTSKGRRGGLALCECFTLRTFREGRARGGGDEREISSRCAGEKQFDDARVGLCTPERLNLVTNRVSAVHRRHIHACEPHADHHAALGGLPVWDDPRLGWRWWR